MTKADRICTAAFAADAALYLVMLSLPFRALSMGAAAWQLGLIPALYAIPYSLIALLTGRRDNPRRRRNTLRLGVGLAVTAVAILGAASELTGLLAWIPLLGIGLGAYWPTLHATISDAAQGGLPGTLGRYNMSWSAGKGMGFLAGGMLLARFGALGITTVAMLLLAGAAWFSTRTRFDGPAAVPRCEDERAHDPRYRIAAWLVNGTTFALAATLNHHLPKLAGDLGIDERGFGVFLGLVFFSQTTMFAVLRRWQSWRDRAGALVALPASLTIVALLAPAADLSMLLLMAPWIGVTMGLAYQSSLYYSVRTARTRGRDSGVHEAVLQTTAVIVPLGGGLLVAPLESSAAPFHLAALACVATSSTCAAIFWRTRRPAS